MIKRNRNKHDQYFTPAWVTKALLDNVYSIEGEILEPANGLGGISNVLKESGLSVVTSDIDPTLFCLEFLFQGPDRIL